MTKKYFITCEQLEEIEHYKNMFELYAEKIDALCQQEVADITVGFELGRLHYQLRETFINIMEFKTAIDIQNLKEEKESLDIIGSNLKCFQEIIEYYQERSDMKIIAPPSIEFKAGMEYILFDIEQILKKYGIITVPEKEKINENNN